MYVCRPEEGTNLSPDGCEPSFQPARTTLTEGLSSVPTLGGSQSPVTLAPRDLFWKYSFLDSVVICIHTFIHTQPPTPRNIYIMKIKLNLNSNNYCLQHTRSYILKLSPGPAS